MKIRQHAGTLYEKLLKMYTKCANIHNFNIGEQGKYTPEGQYNDVTIEEFVILYCVTLVICCRVYRRIQCRRHANL